MKIYFDGAIYSWQKGGGIYKYFDEILNYCGKDKGLETTLLMPTPIHKTPDIKNVSIKYLTPLRKVPGFIFEPVRKIMSPINRLFFEKYFKRVDAGVFHSTYYTTYKNLRIPQVLTVHDMTYEKFPNFFSSTGAKRFMANKKKCLMRADSIICVSEATKKALLNLYEIEERKISVIYHGISESFLRETVKYKNILLDKPYFLFVGNRRDYKNFNFFIEAFSKWNKNKNYNLLTIGGGKLSEEEILLINKLSLNKQVKHLGSVEEKYLKDICQRSEAFVFPSLDEGFGLPIIEAISSKTIVIASNIEVFKEIGENMLIYFDPKETDSIINALEKSTLKETGPEELEKRAKYVVDKFSWNKCAKETIEIYKKTTK
ncbi:MAG: glycosyltransferase family 1 protein [bacterium]